MTQGISYEGNTLVGVVDKTIFEVPSFVEIIFGTSEKQYAFMESPDITEVTFQEGSNLTTIQEYAFYNCKKLKGICLSSCKSLNYIDKYAFAECSALKYVYFPDSLITLDSYCFYRTTNLENVSFPASVETIGSAAFQESGFKNITFAKGIRIKNFVWRSFSSITVDTFPIPSSITSIVASCFELANIGSVVVEEGSTNFFVSNGALLNSDNTKVVYFPRLKTQCSLPLTVTEILSSSFYNSKIESITFPKNLQIIGGYAFSCARSLKQVVFPASLKEIQIYAFHSASSLEKITFEGPANISSIGSNAFSWNKLTNVTIPESVKSIGSNCFNSNHELKYIKLPSNLSSLDGGVFTNCPSDIVIDFGNESNYIIEHFLFMDRSKTYISQYIGDNLSTIIIPETIEQIKASSFANKIEITNVTFLGNCLKSIGEKAFSGCKSLKTINIPNSLSSIGKSAFEVCTSLESISLGNSIKEISERCFYNCTSLKSFVLPNEITIIRNSGFAHCTNLTSITIAETSKLKTIEKNAFSNCLSLTSIAFPPLVTKIGNEVFLLSGLTTISFSGQSTITEISEHAFSGASNLCSISFPTSVKKLNYQCFDRTAFETFILPNTIEELDNKCFSNCIKLKTFVIGSNSALTSIGQNVFQGCTSLATITANCASYSDENGVLFNKEKDALIIFPPASSIRLFSFPVKVKTISYGALSGCTNIELVLLPEGMTTIGEKAFQGCRNLKTINIPSTVVHVYSDAFEGCRKILCGQDVLSSNDVKKQLIDAHFPLKAINQCQKPSQLRNCNNDKSYIAIIIGVLLFSK